MGNAAGRLRGPGGRWTQRGLRARGGPRGRAIRWHRPRVEHLRGLQGEGRGGSFVRGINTIQLMQDGARWWILSIGWDTEREDQPLPPLPAPGHGDPDGRQGRGGGRCEHRRRGIAADDERILALGGEDEILALKGASTRVVDLDGRLAIPGFIEGHGHFLGVGDSAMRSTCARRRPGTTSSRSWHGGEELPPGTLIRGRGWHQESGRRHGSHRGPAAARHPLGGLPRTHGHPDPRERARDFANALAMRLASITKDTVDPEGGEIVRDAGGVPIGPCARPRRASCGPRRCGPARGPRGRWPASRGGVPAEGRHELPGRGRPVRGGRLLTRMAEEGTLDVRVDDAPRTWTSGGKLPG